MKTQSSIWFLPRIRDMLFVSIFIAVMLSGQHMVNLDGDLPRHLLMGKYILANLSIPTNEPFIYPYYEQPFVPHEWLTNVVLYLLYLYSGLPGTVVISALLLAITFTILYDKQSKILRLQLPILVLIVWGAGATSLNWAIRPHVFSMFLLAVWLIWTSDLEKNEKYKIWRFPVLMLVWSNLHGEFIAGILVLSAYAAGWVINYVFDRTSVNMKIGKNIFLALFSSAVASLVNPSGIGPWLTILGFLKNQYLILRIAEAHAPSFQFGELRIFFGLLIFSIFLLAVKRERLSTGKGLLLAGFSLMGLMAIRNVHLYGIVIPFVLAETLVAIKNYPFIFKVEQSIYNIENRINGFFGLVICLTLFSLVTISNIKIWETYQFIEPTFPVRAVEWLEENPQEGRMFNDLNWGGYIALNLWPAQPPFIDSLADTTGDATKQYERVISLSNGWQEVFTKYDISYVIIPVHSPLAKELSTQGWKDTYRDETAVILVAP